MDNFNEYYAKLNSSQKDAADALKGPLLVLAGPGTGKTELLSVRAANIIHSKQANPENILILTYTNAASRAMKERLVKILGPHGYDIEQVHFIVSQILYCLIRKRPQVMSRIRYR